MSESKLRNINVTVDQLEKLVNDLPADLPDDKSFSHRELKSLVRRGVYARVLADLLCYAGSNDDETGIYIPYNTEGIIETDWNSDPLITDPKIAKWLITMNKFINKFEIWYTNDYYGEQELSIEQSYTNFNTFMQEAHDWVINRLRNANMLVASEFDEKGIPLYQEDGYSYFKQVGTAILVPTN